MAARLPSEIRSRSLYNVDTSATPADSQYLSDFPESDSRRSHNSYAYIRRTQGPNLHARGLTPYPLIESADLPRPYNRIFAKYTHFNAIQSASFEDIFQSNDNVVVSSPTGSGKTVLFELAICRLMQLNPGSGCKIIYMAPTKALCAERVKDWTNKFQVLGLRCGELTGDTTFADLPTVKECQIIITTPEKWDSISRRWQDSERLVQLVHLFLIDEVHMLNDKRGATLEVVVSRMRQVNDKTRFIALSATVPNINDVARWLGRSTVEPLSPARTQTFGESFRPVTIEKFVYGFPKSEKLNDFAFDATLNKQVYSVIEKHARRKPTIVFCATRSQVVKCAKTVAHEFETARMPAWDAPQELNVLFKDKELNELCRSGVAFHHAGLDMNDRNLVENLFLDGKISVITATSTLAVGVNLPAHLVILKNTLQYAGGSLEEYSDLEILQMIGRAGRPQFDESGTAVILTEESKVITYRNIVSGTEVLESFLHCTFRDLAGATCWLKSTFLYVRMKQNPQHYRIGGAAATIEDTLQALCKKDIDLLASHDLLRTDQEQLRITGYGNAMAKYYVRFETMCHILKLPKGASMQDVLIALCKAQELSSHRFRNGEKPLYNELKKDPGLKFTYSDKTSEIWHKILILSQLDMSCVDLSMLKDKHREALNNIAIHKASIRLLLLKLLSCTVDCKLETEDSVSIQHALELKRSIAAKCWKNHSGMLKQLTGIGDGSLKTLVSAGITSFERLLSTDPRELERIFRKNPPFGNAIINDAKSIPNLCLDVELDRSDKLQSGVRMVFKVRLKCTNKPRVRRDGQAHFIIFIAETGDGRLLDFRRQAVNKIIEGKEFLLQCHLIAYTDQIKFTFACEELVGPKAEAMHKVNYTLQDFPAPTIEVSTHTVQKVDEVDASDGTDYVDVFEDDEPETERISIAQQIDNLLKMSSSKKQAGAEDAQKIPVSTPVTVLRNGNYACNHSCKDKTRCAHICCKEGKSQPNAKQKITLQRDAVLRAREAAKESLLRATLSKSPSIVCSPMARWREVKEQSSPSMSQPYEVIDLTDQKNTDSPLIGRSCDIGTLQKLHESTTANQSDTAHGAVRTPKRQIRCPTTDLLMTSGSDIDMPRLSPAKSADLHPVRQMQAPIPDVELDDYGFDASPSDLVVIDNEMTETDHLQSKVCEHLDVVLPVVSDKYGNGKRKHNLGSVTEHEIPIKRQAMHKDSPPLEGTIFSETDGVKFTRDHRQQSGLEVQDKDHVPEFEQSSFVASQHMTVSQSLEPKIADSLAFLGGCFIIGEEDNALMPPDPSRLGVNNIETRNGASRPTSHQATRTITNLPLIVDNSELVGPRESPAIPIDCLTGVKSVLDLKANVKRSAEPTRPLVSSQAFADLFANSGW